MNRPKTIPGLLLAAALLAVLWEGVNSPFAQDMSAAPKQSAWTLADALAQMSSTRRTRIFSTWPCNRAREGALRRSRARCRLSPNAASASAERRNSADLFSIFTARSPCRRACNSTPCASPPRERATTPTAAT